MNVILMKLIMGNTTRLVTIVTIHKIREPIHTMVVGADTIRILDLLNVVQVGFNQLQTRLLTWPPQALPIGLLLLLETTFFHQSQRLQ